MARLSFIFDDRTLLVKIGPVSLTVHIDAKVRGYRAHWSRLMKQRQ